MIQGLYDAGNNLYAQTKSLELVANNLANISTTGYKREVPFSEYITRLSNQPMDQFTDFTEGTLTETKSPLDLAVTGNAFFVVETSRGRELTRNGKFKISDDGYLVNGEGDKVLGTGGEINLSEALTNKNSQIKISKEGEVSIGDRKIGSLLIEKINGQADLQRSPDQNFLAPENESRADAGNFEVHQGYLEDSNVNPILEMQAMISINKNFEATQKIIKSLDDTMSRTKEIGKV